MIILHEVTLKLERDNAHKSIDCKIYNRAMFSAKAIKNLPFESNRKGSL